MPLNHPGSRTRVAALMDTAQVSGPGRQLAALVPQLAGSGVDVLCVLFQRDGARRSAYTDFLESLGVPHVVIRDRGRFDLSVISRVQAALAEWRPDIVQTHSYRPTAIAWALRRAGARWRWVGFFHGTTNEDLKVRVYHWLDRRLLRAADRVVVMSRAQASLFAGLNQRVVQIHNAVLPQPGQPLRDSVVAQLSTISHPRIGVIGRLSHEKGVDVLLDALRMAADAGCPAHTAIAGDGPELARLKRRAAELDLSERVSFLGPVYPAGPLYPELDLVVIPSRSEGLPNVLLEALHADRRVVATDVGAVTEVLSDPAAGRVVPAEDPAALAQGIMAALAEAPTAGAAARRAAVERFSLVRRADAHLALYRNVLETNSSLQPDTSA